MTYPQGTNARLIEVAAAEIGTIEEGNNLTKYGKFTKADGLPWCGSFVLWCAAQSGIKIPNVVSTAAGAHKFKETNRWSNLPSLGALAFMDFPHDGVDRISHIGIVIDFEHGSDVVTCIEGNTSGTGDQRNGGMVMIKQRSLKRDIVGFGVPKFVPYKGDFPKIEMPAKAVKPKKETKKWIKPKSKKLPPAMLDRS
jgi:hypothetical protein